MALLLSRKLLNISRISKPPEIYQLGKFSTTLVFDIRSSGPTLKKVEDDDEEKSRPVKFTTSAGYNLNPNIGIMRSEKDDTPWFQGPVIAFSLACFLIYFTMLREENDVDLELSGKLYDKVDGLEKADVLNNIRFREERGLDTTELRERLRVLIELEEEQKQKS